MDIWDISVITPGESHTTACLMTSWHLFPGECIKLAAQKWQVNCRISKEGEMISISQSGYLAGTSQAGCPDLPGSPHGTGISYPY